MLNLRRDTEPEPEPEPVKQETVQEVNEEVLVSGYVNISKSIFDFLNGSISIKTKELYEN